MAEFINLPRGFHEAACADEATCCAGLWENTDHGQL
jgi:hypothetical protein